MCFAFGRAVMCPLPEVTANSDTFLKFRLILLNLKGDVFSAIYSRHTWHLFLLLTVHWKFSYCIVTRFFQNFSSVKGIPIFWVTALVCALLLKVRLIVIYSLTHLSMKIIWLLLWLYQKKFKAL